MGVEQPARLSHPPGGNRARWTGCRLPSPGQMDLRPDGAVLGCMETLAADQPRKWLTKWRPKSADLSIMRDSHRGIGRIKGPVVDSGSLTVKWGRL